VKWSALVALEVPPEFVTLTSTVPTAPVGATAVNCVSDKTVQLEANETPNLTAEALVKFVPVTVTKVPPPVGPELTLRPVTVGADWVRLLKVKVEAPLVPLGVTTVRFSVPVPGWKGSVHTMVVSERTVKVMVPKGGAPPIDVAPVKWEPVSVTTVGPPCGADDGDRVGMLGPVSEVLLNCDAAPVLEVPPPVVTVT
jgi:hypothetical protein